MQPRKELPISMQSFEHVIAGNCIYVDKTKYVRELAKSSKMYFLSRPRRFGKSLLVSTFECLFEGREDLFKGLWIHENGNWEWKRHPVVVLDFNGIPHKSAEELNTMLNYTLEEQAGQKGIKLNAPSAMTNFKEFILKLKNKTGQDVVLLIDEYDKPIIDLLGQGEEKLKIAVENRNFMKEFYGVLKDSKMTGSLRFVFITGVSQFSKVSIFSDLNNLDDLTMQKRYGTMLGYTFDELIHYFDDRISELANSYNMTRDEAIQALNAWYDGFRFSEKETRVFNPVSILKSLNELSFKNYWFETGSPSFLVNLLKENDYYPPNLEKVEVSEEMFTDYDIENLSIEPLMFQTGYLTIKDVRKTRLGFAPKNRYALSYPNEEVRSSLSMNLFSAYSKLKGSRTAGILDLPEYLAEERYEDFFDTMKSLFASIPYNLIARRDEGYFHTLFYLMIRGSGLNPQTEVLTSRGRIDLLMEFTDKVFIVEFKCDQNADKAIAQIKRQGYAERYQDKKKKVLLLGIDFGTEERNIKEWRVEEDAEHRRME